MSFKLLALPVGALLLATGFWGGVRLSQGARDSAVAGDLGSSDGWLLRLSPDDQGRLVFPNTEDRPLRAEISKAQGPRPWSITLVRPLPAIQLGARFRLRIRVRSDAPRTVAVLVQQNRPPFQAMGLWHNLDLTASWQALDQEFTASAADGSPLLVLNLGGEAIAVEVDDFSIEPLSAADEKASTPSILPLPTPADAKPLSSAVPEVPATRRTSPGASAEGTP